MRPLRFAAFGAGFWAHYQLSGWLELRGATCVALYNRTRSKAEALAASFGVPSVYDDAEELLRREDLDFVDVITDVGTHRHFVEMAAQRHVPVICQKPMAPTIDDARAMVTRCAELGVPLHVHENWRWQTPIRMVKRAIENRSIGTPFRARISFVCSFPVFEKQPFLRDLDQFILTDIGSHVLDVARFLFGEPASVYCRTSRVNPSIRGEDVATVVLDSVSGATIVCEMSYASLTEHERFPQTFIFVEGADGSIELAADYWLRVTTETGTVVRRIPPPRYAWADPAYDVVHASIVDCNRSLLAALQGERPAETCGADNLLTMELVYAAYDSAAMNQVVRLNAGKGEQ